MPQIHIIDGQSHEILDFITANNIIGDTHRKSLIDTLETYNFLAFADKRFSAHLEKRNRIIIPDEDESLVEFVIFEAHKYKDGEDHKAQVYAHASYLELKKASILYPSTFEGTASQHGGRALNDTGWQIGIVEGQGTRTLTIESHTNPYEFLKRIAKEFGLELRFRTEHDGNKITGRYVDLLERVGQWRGREVEFGKDLDGIRRIEKQDIVTALLGLGPEREDGTRLEVLVEDEDALQRWGRIDEHGNLKHLIEPYEIQSTRSEMTEAEARQYTRTALDKRINTQVTFETTIVDLENVPGMENKKIRFGDTIKIKDTTFNPPLYLEARVFEQDRSIKSKAKKDIKLGDFIEHTEEEVNAIWKQLQKQIQNRVSYYEMVEHTYDRLTIDNKDEAVFTDGKTFAEAVGVESKAYADAQDALIKVDAENYADGVAQSALDQAKMYAVAQTVYDTQMQNIANDLADRTTIEYVDGKLVDKANVGDVYTISDVDNMINNTVSVTQYTTDMNGIVTDLESQGTRIGQNETAIGLRATKSELENVEGSLSTQIGNVDVKADEIIQSVSNVESQLDGVSGRVSSAEGSIQTLAGQVALKASQSSVDSLSGRVGTAESTINLLPTEIDLRVNAGIGGLEIGGRNLIEGSTVPFTYALLTNNSNYHIFYRGLERNSTFAFSSKVEVLQGSTDVISIYAYLRSGESMGVIHLPIVNGRVTGTFTTDGRFDYNFLVYSGRSGATGNVQVRLTEYKLEKGNKATDWSPAPEDQVDKANVISSINLSPEAIKLSAARIEFDGHVFGTNATFTGDISGATITGGTIINESANRIAKIGFGTYSTADKTTNDVSMLKGGRLVLGRGTVDVMVNDLEIYRNQIYAYNTPIIITSPDTRISGDLTMANEGFIYTSAIDNNPEHASPHIYLRPRTASHEVRATVTGTTNQYVRMTAFDFYTTGSTVVLGAHGRLNAISGRTYIQNDGEIWNTKYASSTLVNSVAKAFNTSSLASLKTDIVPLTFSALEKLKNADLFSYRFITDVEEGNMHSHIGFAIGEGYNTPFEVIGENGETIDSYAHSTLNSKAIQELIIITDDHADEINWLKMGNQLLKCRIQKLEGAA